MLLYILFCGLFVVMIIIQTNLVLIPGFFFPPRFGFVNLGHWKEVNELFNPICPSTEKSMVQAVLSRLSDELIPKQDCSAVCITLHDCASPNQAIFYRRANRGESMSIRLLVAQSYIAK